MLFQSISLGLVLSRHYFSGWYNFVGGVASEALCVEISSLEHIVLSNLYENPPQFSDEAMGLVLGLDKLAMPRILK